MIEVIKTKHSVSPACNGQPSAPSATFASHLSTLYLSGLGEVCSGHPIRDCPRPVEQSENPIVRCQSIAADPYLCLMSAS